MHYQLVVQMRGNSLQDLDEVVALEDDLIEVLGASAEVDGHDIGSGETNIFIVTPDPLATFLQVRPILERADVLPAATVAYRDTRGQHYTVLWPIGSDHEFAIS